MSTNYYITLRSAYSMYQNMSSEDKEMFDLKMAHVARFSRYGWSFQGYAATYDEAVALAGSVDVGHIPVSSNSYFFGSIFPHGFTGSSSDEWKEFVEREAVGPHSRLIVISDEGYEESGGYVLSQWQEWKPYVSPDVVPNYLPSFNDMSEIDHNGQRVVFRKFS